MPASVSPIAAQLGVQGIILTVGTSLSPGTTSFIANMDGYNQAMKSTVIMTTNVGDNFVRRFPTIVDPGEVTFSIWYIPDETSHRNSADSTGVSAGLRYLLIKRLLRPWEATYPADPNGGTPTDTYQAFVTSFSVKGKVAGAFQADIALGINDQNPQFC